MLNYTTLIIVNSTHNTVFISNSTYLIYPKRILFTSFFGLLLFSTTAQLSPCEHLAQQLLLAIKTGAPSDTLLKQISEVSQTNLLTELKTDANRTAFWINLYNAFTQYELSKNASQYSKRQAFFKAKLFTVAGQKMSLNQIEHGILRRNRSPISLGYWGSLFPSKFIKSFMVDSLDFRIHFALNCGAESCPPIAFYNAQKINEQLNLAMYAYLKTTVEITDNGKIARVPKTMSWFRGDFGGKKGILHLLKTAEILPVDSKAHIKFLAYNWTLSLSSYN